MTDHEHSTRFAIPNISPEEALRLVQLLETLQRAIWQVHGHSMSEFLSDRFVDATQHGGHIDELQLDLSDTDLPF